MRIVLAPDKFKGSLTAGEVATALGEGITAVVPDAELRLVPVADGGDGTVDAALAAGYDAVHLDAAGPTGVRGRTTYARSGPRAVVELAGVVGLGLLPGGVLEPLTASTYGLGEVLRHAIEHGATDVVLGLGGSASTDGGAGMVQAMGARLLDADGAPAPPGGAGLEHVASLDVADLDALLHGVRVTVACDVDSPLLGPCGAAAVFGPQKGATPEDVSRLDAALARWAGVVRRDAGRRPGDRAAAPGAGAAGGTGFAALALLGAELVAGVDLVLDLVGFADQVAGADLCVTGEGSLDAQSLAGKTPVGVARVAAAYGVPVVAVAGRSELGEAELAAAGIGEVHRLSDREPDPSVSMREARALLRGVGRTIGHGLRTAART